MGARRELQWGERTTRTVGGVDVHVEHLPGPRGVLVAGLHGFASGTFTWAGIASGLSTHASVVAWDRPPFGRSGRPVPTAGPDDPYSPAAEIARSTALTETSLASLGADRLVLVGHSAGALVAVQLVHAARLPVAGVVLLAPALAGEPPAFVRRLASAPGAGRLGRAALGMALRGAGPALRAMSRHPSPLIEATAAETAALLRRPGTARALWHLTATWQPPAILDDLGPFAVPTMVIGGGDDRISPPAPTAALAERLGAELHLLDSVGHAPQEQVPDLVGPLIETFLADLG